MVLARHGLEVGDLVTFDCDEESTGGIIFQIIFNCDPVIPSNIKNDGWRTTPIDENGRKIPAMCINGYVRLKPMFTFFPTRLGNNPKGKYQTLLVYHSSLDQVRKIDLVTIASKYAELGNLIRSFATAQGMGTADSETAGSATTDTRKT